jgi:hypothetical protein
MDWLKENVHRKPWFLTSEGFPVTSKKTQNPMSHGSHGIMRFTFSKEGLRPEMT